MTLDQHRRAEGDPEPAYVGGESMFIGGAWVEASSGTRLVSIDPTTERPLGSFPDATATDVDTAVAIAREASVQWRDHGWQRRARPLRELAGRIEDSADRLADLDVADSGNPVTGMRADARSAAEEIVYFAGLASQTGGTTPTGALDTVSYTVREPYGVVGGIVPFKHLFKFAAEKAAAPLVAGNAVVLKPRERTSLSALELARMAEELLPPGVLNVVTGTGSSAGRALVAHPGAPRVAFTGSVPSRRAVLREGAEHIKHVSVELGFSEPTVFTDIDDDMTIAHEEIFGPVMSVFSWSDVDEVVRRANALPLGLTTNVWTNDLSGAHRMARELEAGYVLVNGMGRRPLGAPFGGWKASGLGKENSLEELLSYTREKAVTVTLL
jgi:acyl-CoA reductase-like NAD-dependent aldehyde dehydrogenase